MISYCSSYLPVAICGWKKVARAWQEVKEKKKENISFSVYFDLLFYFTLCSVLLCQAIVTNGFFSSSLFFVYFFHSSCWHHFLLFFSQYKSNERIVHGDNEKLKRYKFLSKRQQYKRGNCTAELWNAYQEWNCNKIKF